MQQKNQNEKSDQFKEQEPHQLNLTGFFSKIIKRLQDYLQKQIEYQKNFCNKQQNQNNDTQSFVDKYTINNKSDKDTICEKQILPKSIILNQVKKYKIYQILNNLKGLGQKQQELIREYIDLFTQQSNRFMLQDLQKLLKIKHIKQIDKNLNAFFEDIQKIIQQIINVKEQIIYYYYTKQKFIEMDEQLQSVDIENTDWSYIDINNYYKKNDYGRKDYLKYHVERKETLLDISLNNNLQNLYQICCQQLQNIITDKNLTIDDLQQEQYKKLQRLVRTVYGNTIYLQQWKKDQYRNLKENQRIYLHKEQIVKQTQFEQIKFLFACLNCDIHLFQNLLDNSVNINTQDYCLQTPLMYTCQNNNKYLTKILLENGADVQTRDIRGLTAYNIAQINGFQKIKKMINKKVKIQKKDKLNKRHLKLAELKNYDQIKFEKYAQILLQNKLNPNKKGQHSCSGIQRAIYKNKFYIIKMLVKNGADIDKAEEPIRSYLWGACLDNNITLLQLLIKLGANLEEKDYYGNTALLYFCKDQNEKIVEQLIDGGANIEQKNKKGNTPLLKAIKRCQYKIAKYLISRQANIHALNEEGQGSFILACQYGALDFAKFLHQQNINIQNKDKKGRNALAFACKNQYLDTIYWLIEIGVELDKDIDEIKQIFGKAIIKNQKSLVKKFLELDVDIIIDPKDLAQALLNASEFGYLDLVKKLLKNYSMRFYKNKKVLNAFLKAILCNNFEIVDYFIDKNIEFEQPLSNGNYLIHKICKEGNLQSFKYCKKFFKKVDQLNKQGETAFMISCYYSNIEIAKILYEMGANPDHHDKYKTNAFFWALYQSKIEVVKFLIEFCKVDINQQHIQTGNTGIMVASWNGDKEIWQYLTKQGADISITNNEGQNIFMSLCFSGHKDMIKELSAMIQKNKNYEKIGVQATDKKGKDIYHYIELFKNQDLFEVLKKFQKTNEKKMVQKQEFIKQKIIQFVMN